MKLLLIFCFFLPNIALAYIPKASQILIKVSEHAGSGPYQIEQEITLEGKDSPLKIKETVYVIDQDHMRIHAVAESREAGPFEINYLYQDGKRFFKTDKGSFSKRTSESFFDRYFVFRDASAFLEELVGLNILSSNSYTKRAPRAEKDFEYKQEPMVRIGRSGGVVDYVFGNPSQASLWIEQDQFVIRKFRPKLNLEITADDYSSFPRGLMFPRNRVIRWDNSRAEIRTTRVISKRAFAKTFFALTTLPVSAESENPVINDFYLRFR